MLVSKHGIVRVSAGSWGAGKIQDLTADEKLAIINGEIVLVRDCSSGNDNPDECRWKKAVVRSGKFYARALTGDEMHHLTELYKRWGAA